MSLIALATTVNTMKNTPSPAVPLVDGLMVTGGDGLRTLAANWTLLVALDVPLPPPGFAAEIVEVLQIMGTILEEYATLGITEAIYGTWQDRLAYMMPTVGAGQPRPKRGLFNLGGMILHGLFGVVD